MKTRYSHDVNTGRTVKAYNCKTKMEKLIHWYTKKKLFLSCFRSVNWFWMFRSCWIKKWTQFLSITSRLFAVSQF